MDQAELGTLRDAIDTILNWPDSVRDQIAQWLQTDASKPKGADPGQLSHFLVLTGTVASSRASEQSAARERALLGSYPRRTGGWRRAAGEDNPLRQE